MKNALYGCGCTFLLALTWLALDARTVLHNLDARTEQMSAGVYHLTLTANTTAATQNIYWKSTSLQTSRLIGQSRHAMEDFDTSVKSFNTLIERTDASLNGPRGVLPSLASSSVAIGTNANTLTAHATPAFDAATTALNATARTGNAAAEFVEQATPPAVDTLKHVDGTTGHVDHVADHYDSVLTEKQSTWDKIKAGFWIPIKIGLRIW